MTEWMPINTAPKDKNVWLFGTAYCYDGYFRPKAMVIGRWVAATKEWVITALGAPRETTIVPDFWSPLPEKPLS